MSQAVRGLSLGTMYHRGVKGARSGGGFTKSAKKVRSGATGGETSKTLPPTSFSFGF